MLQRLERLLKVLGCFPIGRARCSLPASLMEVGCCLSPHLAPGRVLGKSLNLFNEAIRIESFDSFDDPDVDAAPPIL
jgi:hypothetical protein